MAANGGELMMAGIIEWWRERKRKRLESQEAQKATEIPAHSKAFEIKRLDPGPFRFSGEGIELKVDELSTETIRWADISKITLYKRDLYTTDEVCLEIEFGNPPKFFELTEAHLGWYVFIDN